ncbi:hypothetical protein HY408_01495 [Candidatus Gottesmanbacteria bacterium]|nr:hypothetical protein [Candidatus Gottesmanbacteria bacterium]
MNEKTTGYTLLGIGLLLIFVAIASVFGVFTKRITPIDLFNFEGITLNPAELLGSLIPEASLLTSQSSTQTQLVSPDVLNDTSNLFAHLLLMGFIVNAGFKIATLGTSLIRPVVVKLKAKEVTTETKS